MRHGEAVEYREPDRTRELTELGHQQSEKVGGWLKLNLVKLTASTSCPNDSIDLALVSPYLRTQQTFKALAKGIDVKRQVTIDTVTPLGNAAQCADLIHAYATDTDAPKSMLVITHMPLVSLLSDKVCHGFNAKIFETADTLVVDYNSQTGIGTQLAFYEANEHAKVN